MRLRATEISTRTLGDETIILSLPDSRYFSVTGIGTRIVELLAAETSLSELVATITAEYDIDEVTARRDVQAFVDRLHDARLLA